MRNLDLRGKADMLRLLGHPTRLAILAELSGGVKCVSDIQDLLDVPQSNVSQHLSALRRERIVDYHEDGKLRCYYITRPALVSALQEFLSGEYPEIRRSAESVRAEGRLREKKCPARPGRL
ncbi:MAG: helix-turn-helix transcriptional regulator [Kiritimatiellaeota bacterium]|nr:helix-turn-helix transcriptional regulator [Kiritimatiellota bacterium]